MGWFSKAIPERKWANVSFALGRDLQALGTSWCSTFERGRAPHNFAFVSNGMSAAVQHYISMLQLSAVAATLQENGYVSDVSFFLELLYIILTNNPPADLHCDIETLPFARVGDAQRSLNLWAQSMASELSPDEDSSKLIEELGRYGALLVIRAKITTCEACGDHKGAEKIRKFFGS